jgi:GNAT superfamily N-acetyltransferase
MPSGPPIGPASTRSLRYGRTTCVRPFSRRWPWPGRRSAAASAGRSSSKARPGSAYHRRMTPRITDGYAPGCIGRIVQLHAEHYARAVGFGLAFEAKVARELAAFCERAVAGRDALWLLHGDDGQVHGSIAIDGSQAAEHGAHLRWFITSDALRGRGAGKALLRRALSFVDDGGCTRTMLWTFAGLDAARHLYETHGFRLDHEAPGSQWGSPVLEQRFVRDRA